MRDNRIVINNNNYVGGGGDAGPTGLLLTVLIIIAVVAFATAWKVWALFFTLWVMSVITLKTIIHFRRVKPKPKKVRRQYNDQRLLSTGDMRWLDKYGYRDATTVRLPRADYDNYDDSSYGDEHIDFDDGMDRWR